MGEDQVARKGERREDIWTVLRRGDSRKGQETAYTIPALHIIVREMKEEDERSEGGGSRWKV